MWEGEGTAFHMIYTLSLCLDLSIRPRYPFPRHPSSSESIGTIFPESDQGTYKFDHLRSRRTQNDKTIHEYVVYMPRISLWCTSLCTSEKSKDPSIPWIEGACHSSSEVWTVDL